MVKTITIKDDVYERLRAIKGEERSFSEVLEELVEGSDPIEVLEKIRGSMKFENKEELLSEIRASRGERRL